MKIKKRYYAVTIGLLILVAYLFVFGRTTKLTQVKSSDEDQKSQVENPRELQHDEEVADNQDQVSLLAAFPGFGHNIERDEKTYSEEEMKREQIKADCMKQYHFTYIPHPPSVLITKDISNDKAEMEKLEKILANNPNDDYVKSLNEFERKAYNLALFGTEDDRYNEIAPLNEDALTSGCLAQSYVQLPGVYAKRNELQDELEEMETSIMEDARLVESIDDWRVCMSDRGHYDLSRPDDIGYRLDEVTMKHEEKSVTDPEYLETLRNLEAAQGSSLECMIVAKLDQVAMEVRRDHENVFAKTYLIINE